MEIILLGICDAGMESNGNHDCSPCKTGFFKSLHNENNCTECPAGTSTNDTGSTHENQCLCKQLRQ